MLSRVSIAKPPILACTWQLKQFFASSGRTLDSKNSFCALESDCAPIASAAVAIPTHTNPDSPRIRNSYRDEPSILLAFEYCQLYCHQLPLALGKAASHLSTAVDRALR